MVKLHVRTFELQDGKWVPVLDHTFFGITQADALQYSESHSKTDSFYRDSGGARAALVSFNQRGNFVITRGQFRGVVTQSEAEFKTVKRLPR